MQVKKIFKVIYKLRQKLRAQSKMMMLFPRRRLYKMKSMSYHLKKNLIAISGNCQMKNKILIFKKVNSLLQNLILLLIILMLNMKKN